MEKRGVRRLLSAGLNRLRSRDEGVGDANRARVLAVAAQKGGVGKTTTAVNLACALARFGGQRVLVVDMDPQSHVSSSLREATRPHGILLSEILLAPRPRDLLEAAYESGIEGLWLTAPDKGLAETDALLSTRVGREHILAGALGGARAEFDTIVLDCPPNLGNLTLNALLAADEVLIPTDMSILAFEGVADLLGTIETVNLRLRHALSVLGILRTRVDGRTRSINGTIDAALADNYGDMLLETQIPASSAVARAQALGQSVFQHQPRSTAAAAYRALAAEVQLRAGTNHAPTAQLA